MDTQKNVKITFEIFKNHPRVAQITSCLLVLRHKQDPHFEISHAQLRMIPPVGRDGNIVVSVTLFVINTFRFRRIFLLSLKLLFVKHYIK